MGGTNDSLRSSGTRSSRSKRSKNARKERTSLYGLLNLMRVLRLLFIAIFIVLKTILHGLLMHTQLYIVSYNIIMVKIKCVGVSIIRYGSCRSAAGHSVVFSK